MDEHTDHSASIAAAEREERDAAAALEAARNAAGEATRLRAAAAEALAAAELVYEHERTERAYAAVAAARVAVERAELDERLAARAVERADADHYARQAAAHAARRAAVLADADAVRAELSADCARMATLDLEMLALADAMTAAAPARRARLVSAFEHDPSVAQLTVVDPLEIAGRAAFEARVRAGRLDPSGYTLNATAPIRLRPSRAEGLAPAVQALALAAAEAATRG